MTERLRRFLLSTGFDIAGQVFAGLVLAAAIVVLFCGGE
jgi:hypothetical protein